MVDGLPVTSGAQTYLDLARCTRPDELVAVGDALYRGGHLDADRVQARWTAPTGCAASCGPAPAHHG